MRKEGRVRRNSVVWGNLQLVLGFAKLRPDGRSDAIWFCRVKMASSCVF